MYVSRNQVSNFEECRRTLKNEFMNISTYKPRPKIVDVRTLPVDKEITYKELLRDLYISNLEDRKGREKTTYKQVLEEFEKWYSKFTVDQVHWLIERLILRTEQNLRTQDEGEEIRLKYFEENKIVVLQKIKIRKPVGRPRKLNIK